LDVPLASTGRLVKCETRIHFLPNDAGVLGLGVELDNRLGLVMKQQISHHLAQGLLLCVVEIRINNNVTRVHQMSKVLGFKSNHKSVLEIHPIVGFTKRLEVSCARLDRLVPV